MQFSQIFAIGTLLASGAFALPRVARRDLCAAASTAATPTVAQAANFVTPATTPTTTDAHQQFASSGVIKDVTCGATADIPTGDQQIAELKICGGISAPIDNCPGNLKTTTGVQGAATWTLTGVNGGIIEFFKGDWEECANAARATCPGKEYSATCIAGGESGSGLNGFIFAMSKTQ